MELQGHEKGRQPASQPVFPPKSENEGRQNGRRICGGDDLGGVPGLEQIQVPDSQAEAHGPHDANPPIHAQHHEQQVKPGHEQQGGSVRRSHALPQLQPFGHVLNKALVGVKDLKAGHTSEHGVCPKGISTCFGSYFAYLGLHTVGLYVVGLLEFFAPKNSRCKADCGNYQQDEVGDEVGREFLKGLIHFV